MDSICSFVPDPYPIFRFNLLKHYGRGLTCIGSFELNGFPGKFQDHHVDLHIVSENVWINIRKAKYPICRYMASIKTVGKEES
jgi:hypothetical protein